MTVWQYLQDMLTPMGVAALLGGLLGLERELRGHWAGLRTHLMVAVGTATFMLMGVAATRNAPEELSRVIQGIATGIGFIGAGTILKQESAEEVKGLTTASTVWAAAAIGSAAALKMYPLAVTATLFALFVLMILRPFEQRLGTPLSPEKGKKQKSQK